VGWPLRWRRLACSPLFWKLAASDASSVLVLITRLLMEFQLLPQLIKYLITNVGEYVLKTKNHVHNSFIYPHASLLY
jgi:hypothetical protein